jgi:hypothetical protein
VTVGQSYERIKRQASSAPDAAGVSEDADQVAVAPLVDQAHGKFRLKALITKHAASFKGSSIVKTALRAQVVSKEESAFAQTGEIAAKPPHSRTEAEVNTLYDWLLGCSAYFRKHARAPGLELCRFLTIETFKQGDFVFKMGEFGDKVYIVRSGEFHARIHATFVNAFTRGSAFGEWAALQKEPRSAT